MRDSTRRSTDADRAVRLEELVNRIWGVFDSASEEQQQRILNSLEKLTQPDRRKHPRRLTVSPVTIDGVYSGIAGNMSADGVFIQTSASFSVGQEVTMDFPLPSSDEPSRVKGVVIWKHEMGVGVKFTKTLHGELKERIESL